MLGHNLGMGHDHSDGTGGGPEDCKCQDWWSCLMSQNILLEDFRTCGNGVIEDGEQCDCGSIELRPSGHLCRPALTECDIPEFCDGRSGQCPSDLYKKNASPCNNGEGFCYHGNCPTPDNQCEYLWGYGSLNGNCGTDGRGGYVKCAEENVRCGSLQCQRGSRTPLVPGMDKQYSRTIVYLGGSEYECKAVQKFDTSHSNRSRAAGYNIAMSGGTLSVPDIPDLGMVRDGTKCAEEKICVNQTCVSINQFIEPGNCPTSHMGHVCSGHGVCSNLNSCYCDRGWTSYDDCSQRADERHTRKVFGPIPNLFTTPKPPPLPLSLTGRTKQSGVPSRSGILPKGASDYLKKRFGKSCTCLSPKDGRLTGECQSDHNFRQYAILQELQRRQQDTPPKLPVDSSQPIGDLSTFIELSPDNLTRVPEKGILKHGRPDNWEDGDDQGRREQCGLIE
ncbi:disintegrin and metalloproteinase domain-containing protein 11 [Caerostris extrusa]|uniref:Disintegrin and metalloproteinase domain-containing protein 11 n=1 Tax=Caerostris extrusa TaxID=172846 RepID=A0AAV4WP84_CAEEX|nr:disintegrin and metalloproteinase domain-containing protein 11 [Caerostris extrusa]